MPLDLEKTRPFAHSSFTKKKLLDKTKACLQEYVIQELDLDNKDNLLKAAMTNPVTSIRGPNLEIPTLILDELRQRSPKKNTYHSQKKILKSIVGEEDQISKKPLKPIPWLVEARHRIRSIRKKTIGKHCVYVIRLSYKSTIGAYVGRSSKPSEKRFIRHISGIKNVSSRHVYKYGQEVLYSLTPHLKNMSKKESGELEIEVRKILEGCDGLSFLKGGKENKSSVL